MQPTPKPGSDRLQHLSLGCVGLGSPTRLHGMVFAQANCRHGLPLSLASLSRFSVEMMVPMTNCCCHD
jgi:hypothetical protein